MSPPPTEKELFENAWSQNHPDGTYNHLDGWCEFEMVIQSTSTIYSYYRHGYVELNANEGGYAKLTKKAICYDELISATEKVDIIIGFKDGEYINQQSPVNGHSSQYCETVTSLNLMVLLPVIFEKKIKASDIDSDDYFGAVTEYEKNESGFVTKSSKNGERGGVSPVTINWDEKQNLRSFQCEKTSARRYCYERLYLTPCEEKDFELPEHPKGAAVSKVVEESRQFMDLSCEQDY